MWDLVNLHTYKGGMLTRGNWVYSLIELPPFYSVFCQACSGLKYYNAEKETENCRHTKKQNGPTTRGKAPVCCIMGNNNNNEKNAARKVTTRAVERYNTVVVFYIFESKLSRNFQQNQYLAFEKRVTWFANCCEYQITCSHHHLPSYCCYCMPVMSSALSQHSYTLFFLLWTMQKIIL